MSLINREALIAEYDRVHVGTPGGARKLMVDAPEVLPEPKWIPVSERLPGVGTYVLVSKKALGFRSNLPNVCTAHRLCDPRSGKEEWNDMLFGKLDDDDVLAWMPLPEPWNGEQE